LLSKVENPINRMILEDRKKAKYGKTMGIVSIALGADLAAIVITSKNSFQSLESLGNGVVSTNTFTALDLVGVTFAILTGLFLLKYKHFSKITFAVTCGFATFFGLTLLLMRSLHPSYGLLSAVSVEAGVALILSVIVMFLSVN